MDILKARSPNFDERKGVSKPSLVILHATFRKTADEAAQYYTGDVLDEAAGPISPHYMVTKDGLIWQFVAEDKRAWHAGKSYWRGERDINSRSIGIELVNPGHEFGYRPFPERQMSAVVDLARSVLARYPIPPRNVVGHSDVAPTRKQDPGELFDWPRLARHGLGVWPREVAEPGVTPDLDWFLTRLERAGYCSNVDPTALLTAFQRRYRPEAVTGTPDTGTAARLTGLLKVLGRAG